jgi:hypothetical protein
VAGGPAGPCSRASACRQRPRSTATTSSTSSSSSPQVIMVIMVKVWAWPGSAAGPGPFGSTPTAPAWPQAAGSATPRSVGRRPTACAATPPPGTSCQRAGQPWPAGAGAGAEQQRPLGGVQDKIAADQQRPLRISGDNGRIGRLIGFLCLQAVVEAPVGQRRTTSATAWASARYLPCYLVAALRKSAQAHLTGPDPTEPVSVPLTRSDA